MKTILKTHFPNHILEDKHDFSVQQFTADDMFEFAEIVSKEALRNAADKVELKESIPHSAIYDTIDKESILSETNIPEL